jgi:hypothetical protein
MFRLLGNTISTSSFRLVAGHHCASNFSSQTRALQKSSHESILAYEWIVDGRVLPAATGKEVKEKYSERGVIVFLHGLLGNRKVRLT